jgi:FAD synthase
MNTRDVVITIGRWQPVHIGHDAIIKIVCEQAKKVNGKPLVFIVDGLQTSKDKNNNPLTGDERKYILKQIYPDVRFEVITTASDILDILYILDLNLNTIVAGSDRIENYGKMVKDDFNNVHLYSLFRDEKSSSIEGVSGTKVRQLIKENNFEEFRKLFPSSNYELAKHVFEKIKTNMKLE